MKNLHLDLSNFALLLEASFPVDVFLMLNYSTNYLTAPQFIHTTLIFLFGSALITVLVSSFVFVSPLFNLSSLFATSVLIAVLLAATSFAHIYRLPGLEFTLIVLFLFFVVRIIHYQVVQSFVLTPFPDFSAGEISDGLWTLVPFLTLFLFGLGAGEKALKPKSQEKPPIKTSSSFKVPLYFGKHSARGTIYKRIHMLF